MDIKTIQKAQDDMDALRYILRNDPPANRQARSTLMCAILSLETFMAQVEQESALSMVEAFFKAHPEARAWWADANNSKALPCTHCKGKGYRYLMGTVVPCQCQNKTLPRCMPQDLPPRKA